MRTFWALLWRDLVLNIRSSGGAALSASFFALIVLLAPLGLLSPVAADPGIDVLRDAAPGLLWIAALLATLLGLERFVQADAEGGIEDEYPCTMPLCDCAGIAGYLVGLWRLHPQRL